MDDFQKVNTLQLYSFWKNLSIGLLVIIAIMAISHILPFYAAPIVAILAAGVLYSMIYNSRVSQNSQCMIVIHSLLYSVINYTVVVILLNVLVLMNIFTLPDDLLFMNEPFLPSLILDPVAFLTIGIIYLRRNSISVCRNCKLKAEGLYERRSGKIFRYESHYQLKNLMMLFGAMSVIVWAYYHFVYIELSINSRDYYVFAWLYIICFVLDEIYFIYRYYNLYLDLKESDEIISQDQIQDMTAQTYLRFYVICDNSIFLDAHYVDKNQSFREVFNTPFMTRRAVNGIPLPEVRTIIRRMTGVNDGELRFFFGRRSPDLNNISILRYFYFLPGHPDDYKEMPIEGEWIDFEEVKRIYSRTPGRMNASLIGDISRLATIILTEKIFNEEGKRKNGIKSYNPSFNLHDVRNSPLDFQDDKWIKISMFNSDTRFYSIKKFFRGKPKVSSQRDIEL
ncbi:MAG: hypothetical protein K2M31_05270 [Muribaculaceae bacterium]|nr:hypothetical protein [Muribaculaceae bacterium]